MNSRVAVAGTLLVLRRPFCRYLLCLLAIAGCVPAFGQAPSTVDDGAEFAVRRLQIDNQRLKDAQASNRNIRESLASLAQPTDEQLQAAVGRNADLHQRLDTALKDFKATDAAGTESVEDLRAKLAELQARRDQLSGAVNPNTSTKSGVSLQKPIENLKPVNFLLFRNRLIPVRKPEYSVEIGFTRSGQRVIAIRRQGRGDPVEDALAPNGVLDAVLKDCSPKEEYVQLFVCADSIPAYYAVAADLTRRGFVYAWSPGFDKPLTASGGSGTIWGSGPTSH